MVNPLTTNPLTPTKVIHPQTWNIIFLIFQIFIFILKICKFFLIAETGISLFDLIK